MSYMKQIKEHKQTPESVQRVWKGGPDPAFPLCFHEIPASCTCFHHYPESRFSFPEKYIRKKPVINVRCRLALSIDILNLRVFLKVAAKTK